MIMSTILKSTYFLGRQIEFILIIYSNFIFDL